MTPETVELLPGTRVIGDLHLDVEGSEPRLARFETWLEGARGRPRLIILGDLFEYWIGDVQARTPGGERVLGALARLVDSGTPVDVIPGNRDFLLGRRFEEHSGARVRPAGLLAEGPEGGRVLFLHGDELSVLDVSYQRLRRVLRSAPVQWLAPRIPRSLAARVARRLRRASKSAVGSKPPELMAMQPSACVARARAHGASCVVTGHGHRFQDERLEGGVRWLVVDAYGGRRDTLELAEGGEFQVVSDESPRE